MNSNNKQLESKFEFIKNASAGVLSMAFSTVDKLITEMEATLKLDDNLINIESKLPELLGIKTAKFPINTEIAFIVRYSNSDDMLIYSTISWYSPMDIPEFKIYQPWKLLNEMKQLEFINYD